MPLWILSSLLYSSNQMNLQQKYDIITQKGKRAIRLGCKDIWNSFMVDGASFGKHDIPSCPTTATHIPASMVTWKEAQALHKKAGT